MRTGRYALKDLLQHSEVDQFIIPELQRDYVWSTLEVAKIWNSLTNKYTEKTKNSSSIEVSQQGKLIEDVSLVNHLNKQWDILRHKQKFGFIYAYHDKELPGKFYLIDGQQRITTFYLLLITLYKKINDLETFSHYYFNNQLPKIDYKQSIPLRSRITKPAKEM